MFQQIIDSAATALDFAAKGGRLVYPLVLFSIIAAAVIIERWWTYRRIDRVGEGWFAPLMDLVSALDFEGAKKLLAGIDHPSARVLSVLTEKISGSGRSQRVTLEKLANHYGSMEVRKLERYLPTLNTIGNVSPLLGLMGTVLGMVKAFMKIEALEGKVNAAVLAGGIWEALLTTLFGLGVAIPAVIAHSYFTARVERVSAEVQDRAVSFVDLVEETYENAPEEDESGEGEK